MIRNNLEDPVIRIMVFELFIGVPPFGIPNMWIMLRVARE